MKRKPQKKLSPLAKMLEHHGRMCSRFVYSDPERMSKCSCGRDAAIEQAANLLQIKILIDYLFTKGMTA